MVLDSLADDVETIYMVMRNCGMAPYGVALVGESHLLQTIRSLLGARQIEVDREHAVINGRLLVRRPRGHVLGLDCRTRIRCPSIRLGVQDRARPQILQDKRITRAKPQR